jgi:hypothetical protein
LHLVRYTLEYSYDARTHNVKKKCIGLHVKYPVFLLYLNEA